MSKKSKTKTRDRVIIIIASIIIIGTGVKASEKYLSRAPENADGCEKGMVFVGNDKGGFCIDMYENSTGKDCPNLNPANQQETILNLNSYNCQPVSEIGKIPWRFISQAQAMAACARAGKRLPTDEEWYQAALGTPDKSSEWGNDDCQVSGNWKEQPGITGSGKNCVSGAGAYDMIGNVWEWVKAEAVDARIGDKQLPADGYIKSVDISGLPTETSLAEPDENFNSDYFWIKNKDVRGMARGGYWDNKSDAGQYSVYLAFPPTTASPGVGFRCVR